MVEHILMTQIMKDLISNFVTNGSTTTYLITLWNFGNTYAKNSPIFVPTKMSAHIKYQ